MNIKNKHKSKMDTSKNFIKSNFELSFMLLMQFITLAIPCGITMSLLTSTFATKMSCYSIDTSSIGLFSLATMPFMLKFLIAPILDSVSIPILSNIIGHRRAWIVFINIPLSISISILGSISVSTENMSLLFAFATFTIFLAALNELAADSLRVEQMGGKKSVSIATSAFSFGFRIGLLIGGGGSLILVAILPFSQDDAWTVVYNIMATIIFLSGMTSIAFSREKKSNKNYLKGPEIQIIKKLKYSANSMIDKEGFIYFFLIIFMYRASDSFVGYMFSNFLLDIGFSLFEIGFVVKIIGCITTCLGSLLGGAIAYKYGLRNAMIGFGFFGMLSNFLSILQYYAGPKIILLYFVIGLEDIFQGAILACLFTFMSVNCQKEYAATQFSILISITTVAKIIFSIMGGYAAKQLGWSSFFSISILLFIPSLFFLSKINANAYNLCNNQNQQDIEEENATNTDKEEETERNKEREVLST